MLDGLQLSRMLRDRVRPRMASRLFARDVQVEFPVGFAWRRDFDVKRRRVGVVVEVLELVRPAELRSAYEASIPQTTPCMPPAARHPSWYRGELEMPVLVARRVIDRLMTRLRVLCAIEDQDESSISRNRGTSDRRS